MSESQPQYDVHNFDAVNQYVATMADRQQTGISLRRADIFSRYAKYIAILLIAAGIVTFLVLWGYSLLKEKPEPKIITTETIIERPIKLEPNIYVSTTGSPTPAEKTREAASDRVSSLSPSSGANPVYNFTIFKEIPFNKDGMQNVVVGMKYDDSEAVTPSHQWCYVMSPNIDGTDTRISLATKNGVFGTIEKSITHAQANKADTSVAILESAQRLCAFE